MEEAGVLRVIPLRSDGHRVAGLLLDERDLLHSATLSNRVEPQKPQPQDRISMRQLPQFLWQVIERKPLRSVSRPNRHGSWSTVAKLRHRSARWTAQHRCDVASLGHLQQETHHLVSVQILPRIHLPVDAQHHLVI